MRKLSLLLSLIILSVFTFGQSNAKFKNIKVTESSVLTGVITINGLVYPSSDGSTGQALITNGSGALSFTTITSDNIFNIDGSLTGNRELDADGNTFTLNNASAIIISSNVGLTLSSASTGNVGLSAGGSGNVQLSVNSGEVRIAGLFYPKADGSTGQALTTDGAGNIDFTTIVSDNIYNLDGTLTGDRIVTMGSNDLSFS